MRILDRYVIREVLWPFFMGLLVFTFMLIIPFLIEYAESFVSKGVPVVVVMRVMATLVPSVLALTIPMSLLLGLLVAFGRLSADREFVAMQACGVSLVRLLRPVGLLSILMWITSTYILIVTVPDANQRFREITFGIVAARAEGEVRPRVFFEDFPDVVLYVRDVPVSGDGWNDVFMADSRPGQPQAIYLARHGRVVIDREQRTLDMVLEDGARHVADGAENYEVFQFDRLLLRLNPDTVFPREGPPIGAREMSIPQLQARAAELEREGIYPHSELFEIQKKFSIPFACVVFGLIGLALGVSNRRDGKLASFAIGIGVIFVYYVLLWLGQSLVRGHLVPPWLAAWMPNFALGGLGAWLLLRRRRPGDAGLRLPGMPQLPTLRIPPLRLPLLGILDRYVASVYLRVAVLSAVAMAGIFYISTFLDLSDKVFRGQATWSMLFTFFWYATPQYVYYILPLAVLLAALVTIGMFTKNSELVVMKACGISLYRVALPLLGFALVGSALLFLIDERILGESNRTAIQLRNELKDHRPSPPTVLLATNQWLVGEDGRIYAYGGFGTDTRRGRPYAIQSLSVFEPIKSPFRLLSHLHAARAVFDGKAWQVEHGWEQRFDGNEGSRADFERRPATLAPIQDFQRAQVDPSTMTFAEYRNYVRRLGESGFNVAEQRVNLYRKVAFPFVTVIMVLLAIPFGVTIGRKGALYGIGLAALIAGAYFLLMTVFVAAGSATLLPPMLAAWGANLIFGAAAAYMLLTVRT